MAQTASATYYDGRSWFLTGGFSLETLHPKELNGALENVAPLSTMFGFRAKVERGLAPPAWSHWVEGGYYTGSASGEDGPTYNQKARYIGITPLGVTYWFKRTAYVDLGFSAGLGLALGLHHELSTTPAGATTPSSTVISDGKTSLMTDLAFTGRFWMSRKLAVTALGALRFLSSDMTSTAGTVKGTFNSLTLAVGVTYALGGAKGVGRSYVEVLPPDAPKPPVAPPKQPGAVPSPTPPRASRPR